QRYFKGFSLLYFLNRAVLPGSKALFNFLKEHLSGKSIEITLKKTSASDSQELKIKAGNQKDFEFAYQKAQEFLKP
ncbi:MAG: sugar ABC transporter permease, partial [Rhizonema sp. NSF051]|nr:sugar ABC transporter permease [Rhizonema sp. NSF051]